MSASRSPSSASPVFKDYDQSALDAQYNNRAAVPDHEAVIAAWQADSAAARTELKAHLDLAYGKGERARLDIFPAAGGAAQNAPVLVFIHGGYWQALDKSVFACLAPAFTAAGITVANIGYPLCPAATMAEIVEHCRAAMAWLYRNAGAHGGSPERLFLSGHSAGGHLSALLASAHWPSDGAPVDLLKGAIPISGLYELEPIRLSYLNAGVRLTPEDVQRFSPCLQAVPPACPLLLAVGGAETDEFRRQQRDYASRLSAGGGVARCLEPEGLNHFTVVEAFRTPGTALFDAVVDFVRQ